MSDEYDLSDFDGLPPAKPTPAEQTRVDADAANAQRLLSHIRADVRQLAGAVAGFEAIGADLRARLAEAAARDADRAEAETARDQRIAERLIDPRQLGNRAETGAMNGVREAIGNTANDLRRRIEADAIARQALLDRIGADEANRRADEARRRRHDTIRNVVVLAACLLILAAFGYGYQVGGKAGAASGYASARDEVAAASWANTANGKLARQLDQASEQTIPMVANCSGDNWRKEKRNGQRICFGYSGTKPGVGWVRP